MARVWVLMLDSDRQTYDGYEVMGVVATVEEQDAWQARGNGFWSIDMPLGLDGIDEAEITKVTGTRPTGKSPIVEAD